MRFFSFLFFGFFLSCATLSPQRDLEQQELFSQALVEQKSLAWAKAGELYEQVLEKDPLFHQARYNAVLVWIQEENWQLAEEHLAFLQEKFSENFLVLELEAFLAYQKGDLFKARRLYQELHRLSPGDELVLLSLSSLAEREGSSDAEARLWMWKYRLYQQGADRPDAERDRVLDLPRRVT